MTHDVGKHAISEGRGCLSSIPEILEDMRNGRMVVLVDAEERENEGDLVIPSQMATPDAVNFMARYGRGLICLTLTGARAQFGPRDLCLDTHATYSRGTRGPMPHTIV